MSTIAEFGLETARELERLPADTDPDKVAAVMRRDGGLVLEGLLSAEQIRQIDADLAPSVDARRPGFGRHDHDDDFYGSNTVRIQGIPSKSPTFIDDLLLHPALLSLADRIVLPGCGDYWMSQAETIFIGPGNPAQELHRDDLNWSHAARYAERAGVDLQISVLVAIDGYRSEVGATMVVPGSHLTPFDEPIDASLAVPVEMEPGSALVYLGSLVHGGGHNRTTNDWRKGLYLAYIVGWLTPEEAVAIGVGPELAATLPVRARELLGWANLRGPADAEDPAEAALGLWQLDEGQRLAGGDIFVNR